MFKVGDIVRYYCNDNHGIVVDVIQDKGRFDKYHYKVRWFSDHVVSIYFQKELIKVSDA